jgi:hypothetical protein
MPVLARPQTLRTRKPISEYGREEINTKLKKSPPRLQLLTIGSPRVRQQKQLYTALSVVKLPYRATQIDLREHRYAIG